MLTNLNKLRIFSFKLPGSKHVTTLYFFRQFDPIIVSYSGVPL